MDKGGEDRGSESLKNSTVRVLWFTEIKCTADTPNTPTATALCAGRKHMDSIHEPGEP